MIHKEEFEGASLFRGDCLKALAALPDNSVDLIVTDPPYYRVKANAWDNQWASVDEFLAWLDAVSAQLWRVLKPAGSLYLFCGPRLSAETELLLKQRFNVLNSIVWRKENGRHKGCCKEDLRSFFPQTERIVFAEHYGAEGRAKGDSGYYQKCADLKRQVFAPLVAYFKEAKERAGLSNKAINAATGTHMAGHWFTDSQWQLPNAEQYAAIQALFAAHGEALARSHGDLDRDFATLRGEYTELRRQYDDLRAQYERLRRPFAVTASVPYTDVWDFAPVQAYKGKHPCEKPRALIDHMITTSSRPGDTVLDAFFGSGVTGEAALSLGREFIGMELEEGSYEQGRQRILATRSPARECAGSP